MRVLLTPKSKEILFNFLKEKYQVSNLVELAKKLQRPYKTINHWRYDYKKYLPDELTKDCEIPLKIMDKQEDNWGTIKAGKLGGKKSAELLKKKLGKEGYSHLMRQRGKKAVNTLLKRYGIKELTKMTVEGKLRKRENESKMLEKENENYFTNEEVFLDLKEVTYTSSDLKKKIIFPKKITPELAEEVGVHLGDGCLSKNRNYFSVKTNKKEEDYMSYLFSLYKKLYNLDLKLMRLPSVVGFEVYSKGLCEFKNKVLGLPFGEKIHKIEVPQKILDTKNKEIYYAVIKGLFDTDGCICIVKRNNKDYPIISLGIKSEKLILQVSEMLKKLGYLPFHNKQYIALNGIVMFKKWVKEIGSNNSKNFDKLKWASSITG